MHDFTRLQVWQRSKDLGVAIFRSCAAIKRPDQQLITSQLRRSALSVSANIAEGCGKNSRAETIRYLNIASGSASETEHHLLVAKDTETFKNADSEKYLSEIRAIELMLLALIRNLPE